MSQPLVTFLVPAYNAMPLLRESVRSMQSQTLREFDAIIVDDGSTDRTGEYLDSLDDSRFKIIHQENTGYVEALNRGSLKVKTKYFARLDADDLALSHRLERQVAFLEGNPTVAAVGSATGYIFGKNREFGFGFGKLRVKPSFAPPMADPPFWNPSLDGQTITHSSATIRTTSFRSVGGYRNLAPAEDTDLWLRLHDADFKLACLPEILNLYRVSTESVSSKAYSRQIQILHYSRYCHDSRVRGERELSFEEYEKAFPLKPEEVASGRVRLQLRNAMGDLLAGHFIRGGLAMAKVIATHPDFVLGKIRARCKSRHAATDEAIDGPAHGA